MASNRWSIQVELEDDGPKRPGDLVRGTARFSREAASKDVGLSLDLCPRIVGPRTDGWIYGATREGDTVELYAGEWAARSEESYPFELKVPHAIPTWKGEHVRVEWHVRARARARREYAEIESRPFELQLPPRTGVAFEPKREDMRTGGGCGWLALGLAMVFGVASVWAMAPEEPQIAACLTISLLLVFGLGVGSSSIGDARLAGTRVTMRVSRPTAAYRAAPSQEQTLVIRAENGPAGPREVRVRLHATERYRASAAPKAPRTEHPVFERELLLPRRGDAYEASIPVPDVRTIGFSADAYWEGGLTWGLGLEVTLDGDTTLRDRYHVRVRPSLLPGA
ncbi:MAG: hypothetical protein R3B82_04825 [Sandaracinaceae bacterium]